MFAIAAAIPIPGSGNRSSQQSTPVGSVGTGTPSFIERPSAIGSAPGADAGLSHQSPLIGGTPPLTSVGSHRHYHFYVGSSCYVSLLLYTP